MLKIGDFSKLANVTIKTLRYYDQFDLLKPVYTDRYNGYRYYSLEQLPRLNRILALKDLGFSLDQISLLMKEDLTVERLQFMLQQHQIQLKKQLQEEQQRLQRCICPSGPDRTGRYPAPSRNPFKTSSKPMDCLPRNGCPGRDSHLQPHSRNLSTIKRLDP